MRTSPAGRSGSSRSTTAGSPSLRTWNARKAIKPLYGVVPGYPGESSSGPFLMGRGVLEELRVWVGGRVERLGPEGGDAVLYAVSAAFAAITAGLSTIALYRVWAEIAVGPYVAAALVSLFLLRYRRRKAAAVVAAPDGPGSTTMPSPTTTGRSHWRGARIWLFV